MAGSYKMLVVDLDGTLLRLDGTVSDANRQAVNQARDSGIEIVIATGRSLSESRESLDAIEHGGLVVAAGGSLLCDALTGQTIDRRALSHELVTNITNSLLNHGQKVLILKDAHATGYDYLAVGEGDLDPASSWWFDRLSINVLFADDLDADGHPHDTVRIGLVADEPTISPIAGQLREELGDRCFLQHWPAVTATHAIGSSTHLLEIFMPNVNKWTMIRAHCDQLGIETAQVAAIGDGLNDIELVREAGLGIATANAIDEVTAAANRITGHHEEDGVAFAIEQILEGEW